MIELNRRSFIKLSMSTSAVAICVPLFAAENKTFLSNQCAQCNSLFSSYHTFVDDQGEHKCCPECAYDAVSKSWLSPLSAAELRETLGVSSSKIIPFPNSQLARGELNNKFKLNRRI